MIIDLLNIEPTTISRDLRGKYILVYSKPKVGKTTFATQCPDNLLLAFEKGYNALSGVSAVDITKWSDLKIVLKQLEKEEVKSKYKTISIDTVGLMWELCEQYICAQHNVETIGSIPWGQGYKLASKEFDICLRKITMLGYGLILIAHSKVRTEKVDDDATVQIIEPNIPERAQHIVNALVDIIGYIDVEWEEDGKSKRVLYTRETPTLFAGSRFPHLPAKLPFGYQELTEALARAIELSASQDGAVVVDQDSAGNIVVKDRPFSEIQEEAKDLWSALVDKDAKNAEKILDLVQRIFGTRFKLSEITEKQKDLFELLLVEMRAM